MKILSVSGFVPEQVCDTIRFTDFSGDRTISRYCGYASDFISQVIKDTTIDGAVYPKSCDSSRIISSYLEETGKFLFQINVPARQDTYAISFFAEEIKRYKEAVEKKYDVLLGDITGRTEVLNKRNIRIREIYDQLIEYDYASYIDEIHRNLKLPLLEQKMINMVKKAEHRTKNVFLIGSFLSNTIIGKIIESKGMKIVGDNLPESGRLISAPITEVDGNIYNNIAENILNRKFSPTQNDFRSILESDIKEMKSKDVQGVIMIVQKYCEPYEYLYSVYKKRMEKEGISVLKINVLDTEDIQKVELQIEAFADTL